MRSMKILLEVTGYNLSDLPLVADKVANFLPNDGVVCLSGCNGMQGKTTLIKEICKASRSWMMTSRGPTFGFGKCLP